MDLKSTIKLKVNYFAEATITNGSDQTIKSMTVVGVEYTEDGCYCVHNPLCFLDFENIRPGESIQLDFKDEEEIGGWIRLWKVEWESGHVESQMDLEA